MRTMFVLDCETRSPAEQIARVPKASADRAHSPVRYWRGAQHFPECVQIQALRRCESHPDTRVFGTCCANGNRPDAQQNVGLDREIKPVASSAQSGGERA